MAVSRRLSALRSLVLAAVEAEPDGPVVLALSGGADSAVLGWAYVTLGRPVRAVHVDHGWPDSSRLAVAAKTIASALDLDMVTVSVDATGPGSPEALARRLRYRSLDESRHHGEVVATGHTSTDQAETVVGNLMWGTGLDGLTGIHRRTTWLTRPLLWISRAEVRELARLVDLSFVDDTANYDARYRRVRIRRALASWETSLASGVTARLAALPAAVAADIDWLESQVDAVAVETDGQVVRAASGTLRTLPPAIARRAIRRLLRAVHDGPPGSAAEVEAVLSVVSGGPPVEIGGGHRVRRAGAYVEIGSAESVLAPATKWDLAGPLAHGGWRWEASTVEGRVPVFPLSPWAQVFAAEVFSDDGAKIGSVEASDRVAIKGGSKAVSEALSEAGVPADQRGSWPVMRVGDQILWIPGVRRADLGWVSDATDSYVVVRAQLEGRWKPVGY